MLSQETIRTAVGVIAIVASGVGVYAAMQSNQSTMAQELKAHSVVLKDLDRYDIALQSDIDANRERLIVMETVVANSEKNYARLTSTLDNLNKEIRSLSDSIIRMEK